MSISTSPVNSAAAGEAWPSQRRCITPGCRNDVSERWDESGLLCADCVIEGDLYDRDARWDHVTRDLVRLLRTDPRPLPA